ncbi:hypothetical protein [Lonepinella koalarum]|uniref:hypothetical protein n=1 Tax=Lonepinella koalarum TaxID=53417 RepID=UPI003F6E2CEF
MANAITEHSKKLRAKTAHEWNKKMLEQGKVQRISLQLATDTAQEFDAICAELGVARPQAIKTLCELYRATHSH